MRHLLFILYIFYHCSFCLTVLITEKRLPLIVEQGKSAYLSQAHIPFNRSLHLDVCQIEVDDIQPLSSVAGFIKPKKFSCNFESNTVLYQHEGSSLTFTDTVLLNIYYFRKQYASKRNLTIHVKILPLKSPSRIYVKSQLIIPSWKGISQTISTSLIRIQHDPLKEFCRIKHLNQASKSKNLFPWLAFRFWPNTGILITFNKSKIYEFNFECQQTLLMGLRFMHRRSRSPPLDFLPLVIEISRLDNDEIIDVTYLHIPIQISAKSTNVITENMLPPPVVRAFRTVTLKNSGGTLSIMPSDCLELSNLDKDRNPLVVEILRIKGKFPATFRNLRDLSKDISSFTFTDLVSGLITFHLKSYDETARKEFHVTLLIMDSYFVKGESILLKIVNLIESPDLPFQVFTLPFYTYTSSNRPLRSTNIQIFGNIDLNLVRYRFVNQRLDSGSFYKLPSTLLLNTPSRENIFFNRNDTEVNSIYFRHEGGLKETESVTAEVSIDRFRFIKIQIPIYIVRLHNRTKEYLLKTHMEFSTSKDGLLNINVLQHIYPNFYFHTIVRDLVDISFDIINPPLYGNIVRLLPGQRISSFSSRLSFLKFQDFLDGLIFYQNDANYPTARDSLELRQHGRMEEETIKIIFHVQHHGIDFLTANMNRKIIFTVTETSQYKKLSYLNLNYVSYSVRSHEFKTEDVIYEIVRFPRYDDINETVDAGRLISLKSIQNDVLVGDTALTTKITNYRSAHITSVTYFTQKQILDDDIVYISPLDDIGPDDRKASFMYSVRYKDGYEKRNIRFPILIKAVNNQPPFLKRFNITVPRDEEIFLTSKSIEIQDEDTKLENIFIEFISLPIYGFLYEFDSQIQHPGYKFKANKLLVQAIKYKHMGHNINMDKFSVRLLDGVHTSQIYTIVINITKRVLPTSTWNLYINNTVLVKENSTVILHPSIFQNVLKDFDFKTFPNPMFILVALPTSGNIVNEKVVVSTFNYLEVKTGKIGYQHSSIEIGSKSQLDFTQVWILDTGDSFNLNFTILPVNSQPPVLYSQIPLQVNEGGFVIINYYAISFKDLDSDEKDIFINVLKDPRRGKICVKGQTTSIQTFSLQDIKGGKIIYNNSLSGNGSEFTTDVFTVVGTDGKFSSPPLDVQIFIHSMNDEPPILILNNFNVAVGQKKVLDEYVFQLSDADIPRDNLQIKFISFPQYGNLTLKTKYGEIRPINQNTAPLTLQQLNFAYFVYVQNASRINIQKSKFPIKDSFQLTVSDGKFTVSKTVAVNITGYNRVAPLILASLIKLDKINEKTISPADLSVSDPDTLPNDITFTISKLPDKGIILFLERKLSVLQSFTQNDVNQGKLVYKYLGPSVTYTQDYFLINLFDGKFEITGKKVFIFLTQPIQIPKMSIKISPIKINIGQKFVWDKSLITIANPVLDVIKSLVVTIKGKLSCGAFYFFRNLDYPIIKFTYEDIQERRIIFLISKCPDTINSFNFEFSFFSHKSFRQDLVVFIEVIPRVSSIPSLRRNSTINALVGSNLVLTKNMLYSFDEDTPSDKLTYQYLNFNQPFVQLLVNKIPENNFSQHDINAEKVELCFEDEINETQIIISLLLSDGDNLGYIYKTFYQSSGLINLSIVLSKWQHENLILMKYGVPNQMRLIDGYSGFQWSYHDLLVSRPDAKISVARDLIAGFFYNIETKKSVVSFYQININRGNIYYLLNKEKSTKVYKEMIQFKIFYQKFRISSETLEISWSIVEFEKIKYKLCPQRGLLTINVIRTGNLNFSSQATLSFVSIEAVINQDFRLMSQRLLIFSSGENRKVVSIKILMTGSLVKENKFQVTLQFPKQVVFGQKSTATVSIKNRKTCNGKEYFHPEKTRSIPSANESLKNTKNMLQDPDYVFHDMNQETDNQDLPSSEELETHYQKHIDEQKFKVRCNQNWLLFSQRCYHVFVEKLSWADANAFCFKRHAFLASINSDTLLRWMVKLFRKPKPFWFGLHKAKPEEEKWKYVNNEAILYSNWDIGFPKPTRGTLKECALVTKKGRWKNRSCNKIRRSFICMKNPEVEF